MLTGNVFREGGGWSAHCDVIGAYTQGPTRKEAIANLAECIELKINHDGLKVSVTTIGESDVFIDASETGPLAAEVLKYQREAHGLSLADVAKKLGAASRNAYASYEQGKREPSLSKFRELLAVVAPEMAIVVGPLAAGTSKAKRKPAR